MLKQEEHTEMHRAWKSWHAPTRRVSRLGQTNAEDTYLS